MRKPTLKTNHGFLLVETIISITILIMIAATSISLLVMGHRAINMNKNSLEASWLAQEAVESLRGLRDTNWIRYGYDKENCWNSISSVECVPSMPADFFNGEQTNPNSFSIAISLTGAPELSLQEKPFAPEEGSASDSNTPFLLYYYDLDPLIDYDKDGKSDNDKQYIGPAAGSLYAQVEPTIFYRQVQTYGFTDGTTKGFEGLVTVAWYEGSTPHKINLPVTLTNYQLEE